MSRHYGTLNEKANDFIERHQPKQNKKSRCASCTPTLVFRSMLRTSIPLLFGLASGMLVEWGEREARLHNNNNILEFSDFSACAVTLIVAYVMDALLNRCWPANPYRENDFFQNASSSKHTSAAAIEIEGYQHEML